MYINRIAEILLSNMCDKYIVGSFFMSSPKYTHTWAHSHTHSLLTGTHRHLSARILLIPTYIYHTCSTHTFALSRSPCLLFIFFFLFPFLSMSLCIYFNTYISSLFFGDTLKKNTQNKMLNFLWSNKSNVSMFLINGLKLLGLRFDEELSFWFSSVRLTRPEYFESVCPLA